MSDSDEFVKVKRRVYQAALEILEVSDNEKENPKLTVSRIIKEYLDSGDESGADFWLEVQTFLTKTGVRKASDLLSIENVQEAYSLH